MPDTENTSPAANLRSVEEVGNQHGYTCPNCKDGTRLIVVASVKVLLVPMGTDDPPHGSDTEWDEDSEVDCDGCGWAGKVHRLQREDVSDA